MRDACFGLLDEPRLPYAERGRMARHLAPVWPERNEVSRCAAVLRKRRAVLEAVSGEEIPALVRGNGLPNRQDLPLGLQQRVEIILCL